MTMDIRHHPEDDLLLALSAGSLDTGSRLVLYSHLELCAHCRERMRALDVLGGVLLAEIEPAPLAEDALARTLTRIDKLDVTAVRMLKVSAPPPLPEGARWPRALAHCSATPWRWIGPGMRWSRVSVPEAPDANVFLLRIAAAKYLPQHTHRGLEFTQVLYGRFHDGRALFGPGDFDAADAEVNHQPVVQDGSECICLASLDGRLHFDGAIARFFGSLVGM
ncbi:MAG TPA: ChrR family anti-sigma-E factor [Rhodocyclaceae bacterium]|nr:ChrR family anti-sigma-E factor [Rhodocyclaceae bacterium]